MATDVYTHRWQSTTWSRVGVALAAGLALALALTLLLPAPTAEASTGCSVKDKATGRTYGTLQAAVNAAKPKARLLVRGICSGGTVIERTVAIVGVPTRDGGPPRLTGARKVRVLDVGEDARVKLVDLIVEHGRAFRGAGIRNRGVLILRDVTVRMNTTGESSRGNPQGAGIHNRGTLRLNGATRIVANTTRGDCAGLANLGSAVMNGASLVARNSSETLLNGVCNRRGATMVMNGTSTVRDNNELQVGNSGRFTMNDRSWVKPNPSDDDEGGPGVVNAGVFTMNDASSVRNGSYQSYGVLNLRRLVMNDRSSIRANPGGGLRNGGFDVRSAVTTMNDQSSIAGNTSPCLSAGVANWATLRMTGTSSITGNTLTLDDCPGARGAGLSHTDKVGSLSGVRCAPLANANVYGNTPDDCYFTE